MVFVTEIGCSPSFILFLLITQLTIFLMHVFLVRCDISLGYGQWNGSGSDVHFQTWPIPHLLLDPPCPFCFCGSFGNHVLKLVEPQEGKILGL